MRFFAQERQRKLLLPFTEKLVETWKFDPEMAQIADRHYSRQSVGSNQFMPPGESLVIRNHEGTILFGWLHQLIRDDKQIGINCTIFRNESERQSSDVILECEKLAIQKWGPRRMFTYIDPGSLKVNKRRGREYCHYPPGRCFFEAGWTPVMNGAARYVSTGGRQLLEKIVPA